MDMRYRASCHDISPTLLACQSLEALKVLMRKLASPSD